MNPSGKTDDWFTPLDVFREHQQRTGWRYHFDPCGHHEAPVSNAIIDAGGGYRTENGLTGSWGDIETERDLILAGAQWPTAWCNPPFSNLAPWVERAFQAARCWVRVTLLLPAWTDRRWWGLIEPIRDGHGDRQDILTARTHFLAGRPRFGFPGDAAGIKSRSPRFGIVLVDVWRPE